MTVPYYGENVTCSELYENSDYKIIYFIADIDNDYQNELVFSDMYWASPELVLDVALDGSLQVMNLSKDDYPAMYGAIAKIEGRHGRMKKRGWLEQMYPVPQEMFMYFTNL